MKKLRDNERINTVIVRKERRGMEYICYATHIGFKCGVCGSGQLGPIPKKGDKCRVCRASVTEVTAVTNEGFASTVRVIG